MIILPTATCTHSIHKYSHKGSQSANGCIVLAFEKTSSLFLKQGKLSSTSTTSHCPSLQRRTWYAPSTGQYWGVRWVRERGREGGREGGKEREGVGKGGKKGRKGGDGEGEGAKKRREQEHLVSIKLHPQKVQPAVVNRTGSTPPTSLVTRMFSINSCFSAMTVNALSTLRNIWQWEYNNGINIHSGAYERHIAIHKFLIHYLPAW